MSCPRCGVQVSEGPSCPRCGVIFAKLREARPRQTLAAQTPIQAGSGFGLLGWSAIGLMMAAAGGLAFQLLRSKASAPSSATSQRESAERAETTAEVPLPPLLRPTEEPKLPEVRVDDDAIGKRDQELARKFAAQLSARARLDPGDAETALALAARYPEQKSLRDLAEAVLLKLSAQERKARHPNEAAEWARKATAVAPHSPRPWLTLMEIALEAADWDQAEAAARSALAQDARSVDALRGLGYALYRQDRSREAIEALQAALDLERDSATEMLLARIRKGTQDEKGMTEQRLAHFTVHYDGEAHEDVGREILRVLDRHYATLVSALDHEPKAKITVILFTQRGYFDASGAPAWSGGAFDGTDGKIRIPIGGLTTSLTPEMDETLIHELTHAFIADRTHNLAPRDIHEGLAQYMQGKRLVRELNAEQMRRLADDGGRSVAGFYLGALAFVEHLIAERGQGGMNDLLKAVGETGNLDRAFEQVYGQGYEATRQAWAIRFRQQNGS